MREAVLSVVYRSKTQVSDPGTFSRQPGGFSPTRGRNSTNAFVILGFLLWSLTAMHVSVAMAAQSTMISTVDGSGGLFAQSDPVVHRSDNVDVLITGDVATAGDNAVGIFAQSIGGLGAGHVRVVSQGSVETLGDNSRGVFAQSNAGAGVAEYVDVTIDGHVYTEGFGSDGVYAESTGDERAGDVTVAVGEVTTVGFNARGIAALSISNAGESGMVTVTGNGAIATAGGRAEGILAQSLGETGSGGVMVTQRGDVTTTGAISAGVLARSTADTGAVGNVEVLVDGSVLTRGSNSAGIHASTSGGGSVLIDALGTVETLGDNSAGIYVQSVGSQRAGGGFDIAAAGNILASGLDADGIYAEDRGAGQRGNIVIALDGEIVLGGAGTGSGVHFAGGNENTLTNSAVLMTVDSLAGMAVRGTDGHERIDNYGTIIGNLDLGDGRNSFFNRQGGLLLTGGTINLGAGNTLTNAGILSPGGVSNLVTTGLHGNVMQADTGILAIDLDFDGNRADRITATGNAGMVGQVALNTLHPASVVPGNYLVPIVTGEAGVTDGGTTLMVQPSAVIGYRLLTPDQNTLALGLDIDFSPAGLTRNQAGVGDFFNKVQLNGGSDTMQPYVLALMNLPDVASLARTLEPLVPDYYDHFTRATLDVSRHYAQSLTQRTQTIRLAGRLPANQLQTAEISAGARILLAYEGSDQGLAQILRKDRGDSYGLWLNGSGRMAEQASGDGFDGFDYDSRSLSGGFDGLFGKVVAGISAGYVQTELDVDDNLGSGDIDSLQVALYGSYFTDSWYVDGVVAYGRNRYDNDRMIDVFNARRYATSDHDGDSWTAYGETGRNITGEGWLLQPFAALSYTCLNETGFREEGAGDFSLEADDRSSDALMSDLGARIYWLIETSAGKLVPELSAAWNYDFGIDDRIFTATFAGYRHADFSIEGRETEPHGVVFGAGLTFLGKSGFSTSLNYREEQRSGYQSREIMGEVRLEF